MNFYRRAFLLLFFLSFSLYGYVATNNSDLRATRQWINNQQERKYLEFFLRVFFLEDDFSYTLFGEKPMSFSGITKIIQVPLNDIYSLLPTSEDLFLWKAVEIIKKHRKDIHKNYLFVFNERSIETFIYFINKKSFLKTIDDNIDVFVKELGEDFTSESFLEEILEEKRSFLEIIHYHEGILGILLGYGRHNSLLFQKKADILGRCWGYGQDIQQGDSKHFCTTNRGFRSEELDYLNNKLGFFSEAYEYCSLIPVSPLSFGADNDHPETKKLKKKYTSLRSKINEVYAQYNPFEVMLTMLGLSK